MTRVRKVISFVCECGTVVKRRADKTTALRCASCNRKSSANTASLEGSSYNNFSVLSDSGQRGINGEVLWECLCNCGNEFSAKTGSIRCYGESLSCGCKRYVKTNNVVSESPEYKSYYMMIDRCRNRNNPAFHHYGGRGIGIQDSWLLPEGVGFRNFIFDMGPRPDGTSIERNNVDADYSKENCKWGTESEQGHTKRKRGGTTSKFKGVCSNCHGGWRCYITKDKARINLGTHNEDQYAARIYDVASLLLYGDSTYLNFPEDRVKYLLAMSETQADLQDILDSAKRVVEMHKEWDGK